MRHLTFVAVVFLSVLPLIRPFTSPGKDVSSVLRSLLSHHPVFSRLRRFDTKESKPLPILRKMYKNGWLRSWLNSNVVINNHSPPLPTEPTITTRAFQNIASNMLMIRPTSASMVQSDVLVVRDKSNITGYLTGSTSSLFTRVTTKRPQAFASLASDEQAIINSHRPQHQTQAVPTTPPPQFALTMPLALLTRPFLNRPAAITSVKDLALLIQSNVLGNIMVLLPTALLSYFLLMIFGLN